MCANRHFVIHNCPRPSSLLEPMSVDQASTIEVIVSGDQQVAPLAGWYFLELQLIGTK